MPLGPPALRAAPEPTRRPATSRAPLALRESTLAPVRRLAWTALGGSTRG